MHVTFIALCVVVALLLVDALFALTLWGREGIQFAPIGYRVWTFR